MRLFLYAVFLSCSMNLFAETKQEPPYRQMNYGSSLNWTYQVNPEYIAYKAIAVRVDDGPGGVGKGNAWILFDHDLLSMAAGWIYTDGKPAFINWRGVAFDGSHNSHVSISGETVFANMSRPGFSNPINGSWEDPRFESPVDHKHYGPIPREWGHYQGMYRYDNKVIFAYTIGTTEVLELPGYESSAHAFSRTFQIKELKHDITMRVAPEACAAVLVGLPQSALQKIKGEWQLKIPAGAETCRFAVYIGREEDSQNIAAMAVKKRIEVLDAYVKGGPNTWGDSLTTTIAHGESSHGFSTDTLTLPTDNPWKSSMRIGGFDFFPGGTRAAVCTWNGDVWTVDGVNGSAGAKLTWRRIASGLFQPLGLKILNEKIYVSCRDQIVRLHDLNGDGCIDFYENFNNDHQVTEHFHEFAMGLQTDKEGNFYYAKSARHALPALVPQHGTLIRVSADGTKSTIVASGFRAANGVCVNDDGTFYVTDQEGHWTPKNRINWVREGEFFGNMMAWVSKDQSPADDAMKQPVVWITNALDRSPGELVRVESSNWKELNGHLLNCSYGTGKIFMLLQEQVNSQAQGGVVELPLRFPTGVMRGRFHPDGDFYTAGLVGWSTETTQPGGFYRVRRTGNIELPVSLSATAQSLIVGFAQKLDSASATDKESYAVKSWDLNRSSKYGSAHINEKELNITKAELLPDGKSVRIYVENLAPTKCMSIKIRTKAEDGSNVNCLIHNTIHALGQ